MENICSEIKITYNSVKYGKVNCSRDTANFLRSIWDQEELKVFESFKILFLNKQNQIIGYRTISNGGIDQTTVDVRLIMVLALNMLATGIILAHNHPSGNLNPSPADIRLTDQIKDAGKLLHIDILDHVILSPEIGYLSFADESRL